MSIDLGNLPAHLKELPTPCLLLLNTPYRSNLKKMARHCREQNIALRPHAKTHKSSAIAKDQLQNGATGICCATLTEAEILADSANSILITSPLALSSQIHRLRALRSRLNELICVVDNPRIVDEMLNVFNAQCPLDVLLDLDPGMHRTGLDMEASALLLAHVLNENPAFNFRGIQCYAGNLMHIPKFREREHQVEVLWSRVKAFKQRLHEQRIPCSIVTGGGTGTYNIDCQTNTPTEVQAGSYPFMDIEYSNIEWPHGGLPFEPALFVLTTVISANVVGNATTDAGLKALSTDSVLPEIHGESARGATYKFKGDEHGGIEYDPAIVDVQVGMQLLISPPHCDPTINLYDELLIVDDDLNVLKSYDINARSGRSFTHV